MNVSIRHAFLAASAAALSLAAGITSAQSSAVPSLPDAVQLAQSPAPQAAPVPGPGPQGGHGPHGHRGPHGDRGERLFQRLDTDGDGKLSRAEFDAGQKAMAERASRAFDAADANRDGALGPDERRAFRDAMHAQMGARDGAGPRGPRGPGRPGAPAPSTPAPSGAAAAPIQGS